MDLRLPTYLLFCPSTPHVGLSFKLLLDLKPCVKSHRCLVGYFDAFCVLITFDKVQRFVKGIPSLGVCLRVGYCLRLRLANEAHYRRSCFGYLNKNPVFGFVINAEGYPDRDKLTGNTPNKSQHQSNAQRHLSLY